MLSVANSPFMLSVIMLSVVVPNVLAPNQGQRKTFLIVANFFCHAGALGKFKHVIYVWNKYCKLSSMLRMTHPSRNFFVRCLCMFVWLRVQSFESSVTKVFQKEKLVNSKTINIQPSIKKLVHQELTWFKYHRIFM
jgi:hypothetical protein